MNACTIFEGILIDTAREFPELSHDEILALAMEKADRLDAMTSGKENPYYQQED